MALTEAGTQALSHLINRSKAIQSAELIRKRQARQKWITEGIQRIAKRCGDPNLDMGSSIHFTVNQDVSKSGPEMTEYQGRLKEIGDAYGIDLTQIDYRKTGQHANEHAFQITIKDLMALLIAARDQGTE